MTDKVIIDGIDVSTCSNYDSEQYFECEISSCHCEEINNCYFKQLARAKEEIEKLNIIIDRFLIASGKSKDLTEPEEFEEVFEDIEQTYSEHEELKALVKTQDNEIENLRNLQDDLVARNEELQNKLQALNEIERLLSDALDTEKTNTDESFENFQKCLEIINKVKE